MLTKPQFLQALIWAHQHVCASVGLLEEAIARMPEGELRDYLVRHLEEERPHAEWLLEDLRTEPGFHEPYTLDPTPVAMAGTMYYLIKHVSPLCIFGYMLALENPAPIHLVEELEAAFGKPLCRTVRVHAEEDPKHLDDLFLMVGKLEPGEEHFVLLGKDWTSGYVRLIQQKIIGIAA